MRFPRACRACVGGDIRVQDRCISFISCFHAPVTEEDSWIAAWSPLQPAVHDAEGRASKDEKIDRVAARPRGKNFPRDWRIDNKRRQERETREGTDDPVRVRDAR